MNFCPGASRLLAFYTSAIAAGFVAGFVAVGGLVGLCPTHQPSATTAIVILTCAFFLFLLL
jgi:hypothetical protein